MQTQNEIEQSQSIRHSAEQDGTALLKAAGPRQSNKSMRSTGSSRKNIFAGKGKRNSSISSVDKDGDKTHNTKGDVTLTELQREINLLQSNQKGTEPKTFLPKRRHSNNSSRKSEQLVPSIQDFDQAIKKSTVQEEITLLNLNSSVKQHQQSPLDKDILPSALNISTISKQKSEGGKAKRSRKINIDEYGYTNQ